MTMKNVLITSAGQRVSLVRAFQKEIKKYFLDGKVYTVDLNPLLAPACHVADGYSEIVRVTDENYVANLLEICEKWNIKIIIPTIDTELNILAENKGIFLEKGIFIVVSSSELIALCRDKRKTNLFFEKNGIEVPKKIEKNNLSFPLFIKPYDGSLSKDIFVIKSQDELKDYHFSNEKLMFMEYVDPANHDEFTVDAYYSKKGKLISAVPRKRIFVRAGEISKGVTKKNELLSLVKEKLNHIEGAVGCLTMQFFLHKENLRIIGIEINPRFGGGYPLSFQAGANYPANLIKEYLLDENLENYIENWEDNLLMLRYDDEILVKGYEG